mmetsp:Transcript_361/g.781  ORF Transcript_361/g.781 Transcript_361/m.781 type:complete len:93 (+) Transcript_361:163-441(+)
MSICSCSSFLRSIINAFAFEASNSSVSDISFCKFCPTLFKSNCKEKSNAPMKELRGNIRIQAPTEASAFLLAAFHTLTSSCYEAGPIFLLTC